MAKLPYMKFYPADWIVDTRVLTDEEKSIWIDLLCFMWMRAKNRGQIEGHWNDLARVVGRERLAFQTCIESMCRKGILEVENPVEIGQESAVVVKNRRMKRDAKALVLNALRQKRHKDSSNGVSNAFSNGVNNAKVTPKKSEVRSQKSDKDSLVESQDRPPVDLEKLSDVQKVVLVYKHSAGYPAEDKGWDKLNFSRCTKSAKALIEFMGSPKMAARCIEDVYERLTSKGLTVTLETVVKHAGDWKRDHGEQLAGEGR